VVIDKTTGKGCAWSIASKAVTRQLISEGIMDKPIFRKPCKSRYNLIRVTEYGEEVYIISQWDDESTVEPLWAPSFIDAEIWEQAVSKFRVYERLDQNVEKYLIPEMDEYLQNISDTELVSMTRDFLIEHGVINMPISQRAGKTYYFNENEVYSLDKESKLFPYQKRIKFGMFETRGETCFNMTLWRKAASQFEVGTTLTECIQIFIETGLVHGVPRELSPIDRLIQYIAPPIYERIPENKDEATFDYIRMTVGLPRYQFNSWKALLDEVNKYQHEIYQRVIRKLEQDRQFKRYGIPIDYLEASNIQLLLDSSIEFIFELKEQKTVRASEVTVSCPRIKITG